MSVNIEDCENPKQVRGYSHTKEHSIIYTWEINKATSFLQSAIFSDEDICIESPEFSTGAKLKDSWYLHLRINKDESSSKIKSWLSIFLFSNHGSQKVRAKYLFYFINNNKEKIVENCQIYNQSYKEFHYIFVGSDKGNGFYKFLKIDDLLKKKDEFYPNDILTVCVQLTVYEKYVNIDNTIKSSAYSGPRLLDDFKKLLITKNKSDVVIKVGNEKFDAHKLILSTRSCVFNAMFSHNMIENKKNRVFIPDIDPEVFKKVLEFIYTDEVYELGNSTEELLEASDKYQLQGLKDMCEASLSKILTLENAVKILILADRHNAQKLKESAIKYVVFNFIKLKCTEEFKELKKSQPSLFLVILEKYSDVEIE